jgi:hypothetical protein
MSPEPQRSKVAKRCQVAQGPGDVKPLSTFLFVAHNVRMQSPKAGISPKGVKPGQKGKGFGKVCAIIIAPISFMYE